MNKYITLLIPLLIIKSGLAFAGTHELVKSASGAKYYEEAKFKKGEINKSFYYIRHGETDTNKYKIVSENPDYPLNEEGLLQAQKAAKLLVGKNIKIIVASPLLRTKQTAEIISKELNVPIIYKEGLVEANRGYVQGENIKTSKKSKIWKSGGEVDGAESLYLFQKRIHSTIKEVVNKYDNVLIVSHGVVFQNLTTLLNEKKLTTKNAVPYYFTPISDENSKELYKITPLE